MIKSYASSITAQAALWDGTNPQEIEQLTGKKFLSIANENGKSVFVSETDGSSFVIHQGLYAVKPDSGVAIALEPSIFSAIFAELP